MPVKFINVEEIPKDISFDMLRIEKACKYEEIECFLYHIRKAIIEAIDGEDKEKTLLVKMKIFFERKDDSQ